MHPRAAECGRSALRWAACLLEACRQALFPARCLACRTWLEVEPARTPPAAGLWAEAITRLRPYFCPGCLQALVPLENPMCACCGTTMSGGEGPQPLCAPCREQAPAFDRARAAFAYRGSLREVVQCLKYRGRTQLARPLGPLMHAAYRRFWQPPAVDLILPVPLHRRRLRERGFNQALLLVRRWPWAAGEPRVPVECGVLVRTRATAPQAGLDRRARRANISGAFAVRHPVRVAGRRLLLVDDVITTGATVGECARVLKQSGAAAVDVLALARVVR
ncbi:MAG: ComF family protein [Desulfobacterales bacterium]|jgi:ComF family protein|nr:ComF family protein [Desulfobacterales bacterium]